MALTGHVMITDAEYTQLQKLKRDRQESQHHGVGIPHSGGVGQQQQPGQYSILGEQRGEGGGQSIDQLHKTSLAKQNQERRDLMATQAERDQEEEDMSDDDADVSDEDLGDLAPYLIGACPQQKKTVLTNIRTLLCHPDVSLHKSCVYIRGYPIGHLSLVAHYMYAGGKTHVGNKQILSKFLKKKGLLLHHKQSGSMGTKAEAMASRKKEKPKMSKKPKKPKDKRRESQNSKKKKHSDKMKQRHTSVPKQVYSADLNPNVYDHLK